MDERPSRKTLLSNTLYVFGGSAGTAISQALAGILLLAFLSKYHYGVLTSAVAWIDPLRRLAVFGLDVIGLRRASAEPERADEVVSTLLVLRTIFGAACFVGVALFAHLSPFETAGGPWALVAAAVVLLPTAVSTSLQVGFQARHQNRRLVLVPLASGLAQMGVLGILYAVDAHVLWYVAAISTTELVNAALIALATKRSSARVWRGFDPALARSMLREASPIAYSYLVVMLYKRLGFYGVEATHGVEAVGALGAAVQLSAPAVGLGGALSVSMGAYAASLASRRDFAELRSAAVRTVGKVLSVLVPLTLLVALAASPIVARWAPEYVDAARAFAWMSTAGIWMFVARTTTSLLVALGRARVMSFLVTFDLLLFAALAWWWIPLYGAEGAAMATFAMELVNASIQCVLVWRFTREP
jgi:O-antigen/teichoic acid export membrane protein